MYKKNGKETIFSVLLYVIMRNLTLRQELKVNMMIIYEEEILPFNK